jgi:hypothetical protein
MPATIARVVNTYVSNDARGEKEAKERNIKFVQWGPEWSNAWKEFQKTEPASILEAAKKRGVKSAEAVLQAQVAAFKKWEDLVDKNGGVAGMTEERFAELLREHVYSKLKL